MTEAEAFYLPERGGYVGTVCSQGAWDPNAQTGVAVLALLGHVLEDLPTLTPMGLARITVDLVRPVPLGRRMDVRSTTVREGKSETMQMKQSGKWLSSDCGAIKPMALPAKAK